MRMVACTKEAAVEVGTRDQVLGKFEGTTVRLPGGSDVGVQEERSSGNSKGFSLSKWKDGTAIFQEGKGISSVGNTCH